MAALGAVCLSDLAVQGSSLLDVLVFAIAPISSAACMFLFAWRMHRATDGGNRDAHWAWLAFVFGLAIPTLRAVLLVFAE